MVDGLFFCATLTGRRGGHTPFVQTGAEMSDTGAEAVKPDPGLSWEGHSGCCMYRCLELVCGVLWGCPPTLRSIDDPPTLRSIDDPPTLRSVDDPPTLRFIDDPPTAPHVCCCCQRNGRVAVQQVQMGVSIWGAVQQHSMDGWALSGADVQAPWHGVLDITWLHCGEAQQVGCLRGLESCPLV